MDGGCHRCWIDPDRRDVTLLSSFCHLWITVAFANPAHRSQRGRIQSLSEDRPATDTLEDGLLSDSHLSDTAGFLYSSGLRSRDSQLASTIVRRPIHADFSVSACGGVLFFVFANPLFRHDYALFVFGIAISDPPTIVHAADDIARADFHVIAADVCHRFDQNANPAAGYDDHRTGRVLLPAAPARIHVGNVTSNPGAHCC